LSRSVIRNRPKVLTGRSQKGMRVGSSIGTLDDGGARTRRTIGRSRPIRLSTLDNRVSPTRPATRRYSDRKEGDGGGGRGCRRKRKPSCNGADRAARAGIPSPKGRRLPAGLSGAMRRDASTDGDVRQRKLNRPKDGCRKPPVRRNQDRVLRAAGDRFPRRGGLSRVRGNSHARFLGEEIAAMRSPYPTSIMSVIFVNSRPTRRRRPV
jgi:hypothetical protein